MQRLRVLGNGMSLSRILMAMVIAVILSPLQLAAQVLDPSDKLPPDVRVVIDISGSMKQNDPNNLRQPAVDLLVKLLPEGSKAGVWTFGKNINMLIPHRPVTDSWRESATREATKINSVGLYTNIGEALEKAGYDLDRADPKTAKYRTSLILLTDGLVDISREPKDNQAEWRRIVNEVIPRFERAGFTVHTIALSDNADAELMNKLALSTDGISAVAKTADDLMRIFLKAFDQSAPAEQVPLEENRFVIDSSVEEFTALIFRKPGSTDTRLIGPDRAEYRFDKEERYVSWYRADNYDLITLKRPLEGEWQVRADMEPDSRVTVVSNLNLLVKPLKNNLFAGEALNFSMLLQEDGKTISRAEFLRLLDVNARISREEDGESWNLPLSDSLPPGDGIYNTTFDVFDSAGQYDLKLVVDGKTFKREFSHSVTVRQPFGVELDSGIESGSPLYQITVSAFGPTIDVAKTKVVARVKHPSGRSSINPFTLTEVDNWLLELSPETEGQYVVNLRVNAVDKNGKAYEYSPETLRFRYPDGDDPFTASEPEPVIEPPVEEEPVVEEPVVEEPAVEKQEPKKPEPVVEEPAEEESSKLVLYTALGVGNLLIVLLAFFAYRMIVGGKRGDSLAELEQAMEETSASVDEPIALESEKASEPAMQAEEPDVMEHAMDEVVLEAEVEAEPDLADIAPEAESDEQLADNLMGSGLDLSEDVSDDTDLEMPEELQASDDDDLGSEFSLDDFAPDDLEDEDKP